MYRKQPQRTSLAMAVFVGLATMASLPAIAQDGASAPQEPTTLDKLVVTAQKREEALQDVPVTVTAVGEDLIRDTGVRDVKDLQVLVPGLTLTSTQN